MYHNCKSNVHELHSRINILNEYERIRVSDMCDVCGRYTNQY